MVEEFPEVKLVGYGDNWHTEDECGRYNSLGVKPSRYSKWAMGESFGWHSHGVFHHETGKSYIGEDYGLTIYSWELHGKILKGRMLLWP